MLKNHLRISDSCRLTVVLVLALAATTCVSAQADLLVTSRESNSVVRFTDAGDYIGVFIPGNTLDLTANETLNGGLVGPIGIATRPGDDDHIYVLSSGLTQTGLSSNESSILKYNRTTGQHVETIATGGTLADSSDLIFDADGNAYVSNFWDLNTNFHGDVVKFGSDNSPMGAFASLPNPTGAVVMAFGPNNDLFVSSFLENSIYRFDASNGDPIGVGPFAMGFGGDNASGLLYHDGYLYASNVLNHVILRYDVTNPGSGTLLVDDSFVGGGNLAFPSDLAIAPNGNLLVASLGTDFGNPNAGQILEYSIANGDFLGVYAEGSLNGPAQMLFVAVPEPSTLLLGLTGLGMLGLGVWRRRRRSA